MSNILGRNVNFCNYFIFDKIVLSFILINKNKEFIIVINIVIIVGVYFNKDVLILVLNEFIERVILRSNVFFVEMVFDLLKFVIVGFCKIWIIRFSEVIFNF